MSKPRRLHGFDLEKMLSYRLSTLSNRLYVGTTRQVESGFGLVTREWRVLALLGKLEPVSASELVARSPMDKASVSRAVASLAKRGLVVVKPDSSDRRVQQLAMTNAGRKLYAQVAPLSLARHRALLAALTPEERISIFAMLDKLIARADALLAETPRKGAKKASRATAPTSAAAKSR